MSAARLAHAVLLMAVAAGAAVQLAAWHLGGRATPLDRIEYALLDLRFYLAGPQGAPNAIVVVGIDDEAITEAGGFPLPRAALARLVRAIQDRKPRALGIDLLLLEPRSPDDDAALSAVLAEAHAVLAGAAVFSKRQDRAALSGNTRLPSAERVLRPLDRFRAGTGFGFTNISADHNGTPRHLPLLIADGETLLPSLPLRLAAQASGTEPILGSDRITVGAAVSRLDLGLSIPFRFYGPRGTVRTISAAAVLRGERVADVIGNRTILVGTTAIGAGDTFATPYDPLLPGVEVLATGLAHLLVGDGLVRGETQRWIDAAAALVLALGSALLLVFAPPALAIGLIGTAALAWIGATVLAFTQGLWLAATLPLAVVMPVIAFGLGGRLILDRRDAAAVAKAERALRAFHPPKLASQLTADPNFLAEPLVQEAAILFLDLAGFTGVSERIGPLSTQRLLKEFHALVEARISHHDGVVVTFMGDGAMCVFGLVESGPDDARQALAAALYLVPAIRTWLADEPAFSGKGDLRVGVHYGTVVVSRLGARDHQQITATGDSVNLASRLMEVGKFLGAALVVSEDLLAAAGVEAAEAAIFDGHQTVAIRGREQELKIAYRWQSLNSAVTMQEL